jgi:hypothetical protein
VVSYACIDSLPLSADSAKEEPDARQERKYVLQNACVSKRATDRKQCLLLPAYRHHAIVCRCFELKKKKKKTIIRASFQNCKLSPKCNRNFVCKQQSAAAAAFSSAAAMTMAATRPHKRCAADSSNPLLSFGVLGHHLFVAPVCKWWRKIHATLGSQQLTVLDKHGLKSITIICGPNMTLFSTAFASPSRVKLARESGLDLNSKAFQGAAGKYADVAALAIAHKLGMKYTAATMAGAAQCNKLAEVQYLHRQRCPWSMSLLEDAASSGHFELLRWCTRMSALSGRKHV